MPYFNIGDRIQFIEPKERRLEPVAYYGRAPVPEGAIGTVVQANTSKLCVSFDEVTNPNGRPYFFWVFKDEMMSADPNAPRPRKLGEVPDDGVSIGPDDPRIAWLWKDAEKLATTRGYCSQYDVLTGALNIPGRERTFKVKVTLAAGVTTTISNKAHSRVEAEENVRRILEESKPLVGAATAED